MKHFILLTLPVFLQLSFAAMADVDGDGKLTLADAMRITRAIVEGGTGSLNLSQADVDGDGQITVLDAMRLHQYLGGIWQDTSGKLPPTPEINEKEREFLAQFEGLSSHFESMGPEEFINNYPQQAPYPKNIQVKTANYFKEIQSVYQLTPGQISAIENNGFVVLAPKSQHQGFGEVYREVFKNDLPVYISADAILEPLFRSYDNILKALERNKLIPLLTQIINSSLNRINALRSAHVGQAAWQQPLDDAETYLRVAKALLEPGDVQTSDAELTSRIDALLSMIRAGKLASLEFFGIREHFIDFSQFKPRGHYECESYGNADAEKIPSCKLGRYFQTMMWLGRADCAFVLDNIRHFRAFALLHDCLVQSNSLTDLEDFNEIISFFVGDIDGFSPQGLSQFWSEYKNRPTLTELFSNDIKASEVIKALSKKDYGNQFILSQALWKSPDDSRPEFPKIAQLSGQRFILDSYLLGHTVEWLVKGRNKPVLEEVAFCLGNNAAMPLLKDDIQKYTFTTTTSDKTYKPLHTRLGAARSLFEAYPYWEKNLYTMWLDGLRELSKPLPVTAPQSMRSAQWQDKQMNTQMASWAHLRHNTLLYAKQSYTGGISCFYPDGYVEPYPAFYRRIGSLMKNMKRLVSNEPANSYLEGFFQNWSEVTDSLAGMAEKELKGEPLTAAQIQFINGLYQKNPSMVCGEPEYIGWYPKLFYGENYDDILTAKPVIADVHTIPPSDISPANMVLHAATGAAQTMVLHAGRSGESCGTLYAGPIFSFYKHDESPINRLTDSEWKAKLKAENPKLPAWFEKYKQ